MKISPSKTTNPDRFLSIHRFWFWIYGQWYTDRSMLSIMFWVHMSYRILVWWLLSFFPVGGEIIYLLNNRDDVGKVAEGMYLMLSEAYMGFKLAVLLYNKKKVQLLINHMKSDEFYATEIEHVRFIEMAIRKGRMVSKGYLYICLVTITVGCLMPIAEKFQVLPTNVQYPYFDCMSTPYYQIIYLMQIYSKTSVVLVDGVLDTIMPACIAHALGQLDILAFNLENVQILSERNFRRKFWDNKIEKLVINNQNILFEDSLRKTLGEIISHHNSIVSYVAKIEDAFNASAAVQFMLSGLVICLVGVRILSIEEPLHHPMPLLWTFLYFCCMMTEVFMLCWFGDEVIWKSTQLQNAAFNSRWPDFPEDVKRSITIFRERIKRPLKLTAGKIFTLSLDTFTILLNWSYKAFAVMRNMKT